MRHVSAQPHWAHFIPLFRGQALSKVHRWNLLTGVHQLPQHRVSRPQHWHEPVAKQLEKETRPAFNLAMVWFVWFEGGKALTWVQPQCRGEIFRSVSLNTGSLKPSIDKSLSPNSCNMEMRPAFSPATLSTHLFRCSGAKLWPKCRGEIFWPESSKHLNADSLDRRIYMSLLPKQLKYGTETCLQLGSTEHTLIPLFRGKPLARVQI
jgi:hypothetical protein